MDLASKRLFGAILKVLALSLALGGVVIGAEAEANCTRPGFYYDAYHQSWEMPFTFRGNWTHSTDFPQAVGSSISWTNDIASVPYAMFNILEPTKSVSFQINCAVAFDYYYSRAWNRGYAHVTALNHSTGQWHYLAYIDLYAPTQQFVVYSRIALPSFTGPYTVHIFTMGEKRPEATHHFIDIDGIITWQGWN